MFTLMLLHGVADIATREGSPHNVLHSSGNSQHNYVAKAQLTMHVAENDHV